MAENSEIPGIPQENSRSAHEAVLAEIASQKEAVSMAINAQFNSRWAETMRDAGLLTEGTEKVIDSPRPFLGFTESGDFLLGGIGERHEYMWEDYRQNHQMEYERYGTNPNATRSGIQYSLKTYPDVKIIQFDREIETEKDYQLVQKIVEKFQQSGYLVLDRGLHQLYSDQFTPTRQSE